MTKTLKSIPYTITEVSEEYGYSINELFRYGAAGKLNIACFISYSRAGKAELNPFDTTEFTRLFDGLYYIFKGDLKTLSNYNLNNIGVYRVFPIPKEKHNNSNHPQPIEYVNDKPLMYVEFESPYLICCKDLYIISEDLRQFLDEESHGMPAVHEPATTAAPLIKSPTPPIKKGDTVLEEKRRSPEEITQVLAYTIKSYEEYHDKLPANLENDLLEYMRDQIKAAKLEEPLDMYLAEKIENEGIGSGKNGAKYLLLKNPRTVKLSGGGSEKRKEWYNRKAVRALFRKLLKDRLFEDRQPPEKETTQ